MDPSLKEIFAFQGIREIEEKLSTHFPAALFQGVLGSSHALHCLPLHALPLSQLITTHFRRHKYALPRRRARVSLKKGRTRITNSVQGTKKHDYASCHKTRGVSK